MPSVHEARSQRPRLHHAEMQSRSAIQSLPRLHGAQAGPPQSSSVSLPFSLPSRQSGASSAQRPPSQRPVWQSAGARHSAPAAHGAHEPPQSTPVSAPFLSPSVQLGSAQAP